MFTYYYPLASLEWNRVDSILFQYISKERQVKAQKCVNILERKLSMYAALIVRMGLSKATGIPSSNLLFHSELYKKPYCLTVPKIDFSYSHTRNAILCCISLDGTVGADIEKIKVAPYEIIKRVFHPEEIRYVQCAPAEQQDVKFFEIWTRKESYVKQLGIGLAYDLSSFNTLSREVSPYFHTWKQDSYICSIYTPFSTVFDLVKISEEDIWNYYAGRIDK